MKYDLNLTFGEIFNNDHSALLDQLIGIQHHKAKREASEKWAKNLRFIDIFNAPSLSDVYQQPPPWLPLPPKTLVLPLTNQQQDDGSPYVAFPNPYIERAIIFAQAKGIGKLWADVECIYQRPEDGEEDKKLGIQIMDAVYGSSDLSLGLLTPGPIHQSEVALLPDLLSGSVFVNFETTDTSAFKSGTKFLELQTLILRILSHPRWSRGWIFQEDHFSS
ncbi:hypothetical protein E8E12_003829 [Didymella heteroderae]|uniref:Heterokaryon incompatibility domain-containing protein n=1 Tax=Didymella heteroderae TaxID=1769908 RepID=A0A9P5BW47_9PLEO|nr:hypothetical protein E8E12_003829 [Didymella heteroderae]